MIAVVDINIGGNGGKAEGEGGGDGSGERGGSHGWVGGIVTIPYNIML